MYLNTLGILWYLYIYRYSFSNFTILHMLGICYFAGTVYLSISERTFRISSVVTETTPYVQTHFTSL